MINVLNLLIHFFCQQRIEGKNPKTEDKLVLHLEVDSTRKDAQKSRNTIDRDKSETIVIDTQHHLQTPRH